MEKRDGRSNLPYTGERLTPDVFDQGAIEHLHRYAIAMDLVKGLDVLDIACGEGYGAGLLSTVAGSVIGVDRAAEVIRRARRIYPRENLRFLEGTAEAIPVPSQAVDVVVSFETIEHLDAHERVVQEFKRVLKPGGLLIVSSPDRENFSNQTGEKNPFHVRELYRDELQELVQRHFRHAAWLSQKVIWASIIAPESRVEGFREFWGDYRDLPSAEQLRKPIFNIVLGSDKGIGNFYASVFDGSAVTKREVANTVLYVDSGSGFSEQSAVRQWVRGTKGTFRLAYSLAGFGFARRLRWVPEVDSVCEVKFSRIRAYDKDGRESLLDHPAGVNPGANSSIPAYYDFDASGEYSKIVFEGEWRALDYSDLRERYAVMAERLSQQERRERNLRFDLDGIVRSRSYRLARMLTWPIRKVRNLMVGVT